MNTDLAKSDCPKCGRLRPCEHRTVEDMRSEIEGWEARVRAQHEAERERRAAREAVRADSDQLNEPTAEPKPVNKGGRPRVHKGGDAEKQRAYRNRLRSKRLGANS